MVNSSVSPFTGPTICSRRRNWVFPSTTNNKRIYLDIYRFLNLISGSLTKVKSLILHIKRSYKESEKAVRQYLKSGFFLTI